MMHISRLNLAKLLSKIGYKPSLQGRTINSPTEAQKADWDQWLKSFNWDAGYFNEPQTKQSAKEPAVKQPSDMPKEQSHTQISVAHNASDITVMVHNHQQLKEVLQLLNTMQLKNPVDIMLTY